jgi:hypothetical protein
MDYKNGKIYKIVSDLTDMIYIGSTCSPLSKRHYEHKKTTKRYNKTRLSYITSHELIKLGDTQIELIEDYPCDRKEQLHAREAHYIRLYKDNVVNKLMLGANKEKIAEHHKKYRQANKEKIAKYDKQRRQENKEKIAEQRKQYRQENKEKIAKYDKQRKQKNKEKIAEHDKQYRQENKEKIAEQRKQYRQENKEKIAEHDKQYRQAIKNAKINKILLYELPFFIDY